MNETDRHIIVVDDERNIRKLLAGVLEDEGYTVSTAGDVESAEAAGDEYPVRTCQLVDGAGVVSQPGEDATPDPGQICFVTGAAVGSGPGSYDVDAGTTSLLSPPYDLSSLASASVACISPSRSMKYFPFFIPIFRPSRSMA